MFWQMLTVLLGGLGLAVCPVSSVVWIERNSFSSPHHLSYLGLPEIMHPGSISFCLWSPLKGPGSSLGVDVRTMGSTSLVFGLFQSPLTGTTHCIWSGLAL